MLRTLRDLERYTVTATDGDVGTAANFLLDDERWTVRYLVVDAGNWMGTRRVLISPLSFRQADWSERRFHVALTMEKVKNAPSVDVDLPVSRENERDYCRYYGHPYYWGPSYRSERSHEGHDTPGEDVAAPAGDIHLRSANELHGYTIQGSDGTIGHVQDFIVDDGTWEVRYLVIETSNWWFGRKVLVAPHWATHIEWLESKVYVNLPREAIKSSPEWSTTEDINREYEARLHDHYGRPGYWARSDEARSPGPR
jgi:hypothetical protein